jgi:oligopeptide transport system substrate-binding protein
MKKRVLMFTALVLTALAVMASCGSGKTTQQQGTAKEKVYRWVTSADAETLNAQNSVSITVQDLYEYCSSGLYAGVPTPDGKGIQYIGNIADGDPQMVDSGGYVWRINIRREAKCHNGEPINADTIMYSFKMLLDPLLVNRMANFLYDRFIKIENAREYYFQAREGSPAVRWEDVGIKKVGDYAIELTLTQRSNPEYVKRHFVDRSTHPVYQPYYEAGMNAERTVTTYATTLANYMGCGPYFYTAWNIDAEHVFTKNPNHWLTNWYKFDRVEVRIVPDRNARVQMFDNGEIDFLTLDPVTLDNYRDDPRVRRYTGISPWHLEINSLNTNQPILANPNFRKALFYGVDRKTLGDLLGVMPAAYYVNHQAPGYDGMAYRDTPEGKAVIPPNLGYDPALAKRYFDTALTETRLNKVTIELLYSEAGSEYKAMAEFFEQDWPRIFGTDKFTLVLRAVPDAMAWSLNEWQENPTGMELGFNDWGSSLSRVFPYAAFQYFHSGYTARPNSYVTPRFDAAYQLCDTEETKSDINLMVKRTADLEKIYIEDVINVPLFQEYVQTVYSEKLILPVSEYVPGLGFGSFYGDKIVD